MSRVNNIKSKNNLCNLDTVFCIEKAMKSDNGEDSYYYGISEKSVLVSVFDGCGGIGSKRYENYSGKTGAYVASRAVCGGIESWFNSEDKNVEQVDDYIKKALDICEEYADKTSRFIGSLGKSFPTTAAIIYAEEMGKKIKTTCLWAGDSRCYMLNAKGLHQLSVDDLDGIDAYSNLTSDGVLKNVISASAPFEIHKKEMFFDMPCVIFTATDGCFGYLNSPMDFEYLFTNLLMKSKDLKEWKTLLYKNLLEYAGDDYTMSIAAFGFGDFSNMKRNFAARNEYVYNTFINSNAEAEEKWKLYKDEYYSFYG